MEESISVWFDDKLGSRKSKHGESFTDIEVKITDTVNRSSEDKSSELQPNTEEDITNITTSSEESIQKRQSRISLAHRKNMILKRKMNQSEQDLYLEILKNLSWDIHIKVGMIKNFWRILIF